MPPALRADISFSIYKNAIDQVRIVKKQELLEVALGYYVFILL